MTIIYSNQVPVTVQGQSCSASLTASSTNITLGNSTTLTCSISGCTCSSPIYSWYVDGVDIGEYGSSYVYTPSTSGSHSVYVYVVCGNGTSFNSNSITITVNQPSVTYNVSVTASQNSNLSVSSIVSFDITVTSSNGSAVNGTATLYITKQNGTILYTFPNITITNGYGTLMDIEPGLYLPAGTSVEYYYAVFEGYQSPTYTLTFSTSTAPTQISLSASTTNPKQGEIVTFNITSNGSNFSACLFVYNSSTNANNAPGNCNTYTTGQWGVWSVPVTNGNGSIQLVPSDINTNTQYWIATYTLPNGTVLRSNVVQVQG